MKSTKVIQDIDQAIQVIYSAGKWLEETGKNPSKWWQSQNLNKEFLLQYAKPEEFFVALVEGKPAAAAILQTSQDAQDWRSIDKGKSPLALYIHWLCVGHEFAGMGLSKTMIDYAEQYANEKNIQLLRVDTNAEESKLRTIYENLGFVLVSEVQEDYRKTAFYQKTL